MYGTYLRLNVHVGDSRMTVIRAARKKLSAKARRDPHLRDERKTFYRTMLAYHAEANNLYRDAMRGDLSDDV